MVAPNKQLQPIKGFSMREVLTWIMHGACQYILECGSFGSGRYFHHLLTILRTQ